MPKLKSIVMAATLIGAAMGAANAAELSMALQVDVNVPRTCIWGTQPDGGSLLTSADRSQPVDAMLSLQARCDTGTAYTVKSDSDSLTMSVGGETLTLASFSDAGRTAPYSSGPGYVGVAANRMPFNVPVYFRLSGTGAGGGFAGSGGELPLRQVRFTVNY